MNKTRAVAVIIQAVSPLLKLSAAKADLLTKKAKINAVVPISRLPKPAKTIDVFPDLDFCAVNKTCATINRYDYFASKAYYLPKY